MHAQEIGAALAPGAVQRELDALATALRRSVSLDATDGTLLGYSSQGADVDSVRVNAVLTRTVPAGVVRYQRQYGIDTAADPVDVPASSELGMAARTCLAVRRGRDVLAYLWVLNGTERLRESERETVQSSARRIAAAWDAVPVATVDLALADLFSDSPRAVLASTRASESLTRASSLHLVVAVPTVSVGADRRPQTLDGPAHLPAGVPVAGSAWHRGQLLMLVTGMGTALDTGLRDLLATGIRGVAEVALGISDPFRFGNVDVSTHAARAIVSAGCAAVDPALPVSCSWGELGLYRRILLGSPTPRSPHPPSLLDLEATGGDLLRTLEVFLDLGGDAARCIAALGIHRTTYYYRLDRLRTRYGVRLDNGMDRSDHHFALKTRRLAVARDAFGWSEAFLARLAG